MKFPDLWLSKDTENDYQPISGDFEREDTIGGRLDYLFRARSDTRYRVDRDITVLPEGQFIVEPGARLEFENAIGILVQVTIVVISMEICKLYDKF